MVLRDVVHTGREIDSPTDFNAQFADWIDGANRRVVRTIRARPIERVDVDRAAMLAPPPVPPRAGSAEPVAFQ